MSAVDDNSDNHDEEVMNSINAEMTALRAENERGKHELQRLRTYIKSLEGSGSSDQLQLNILQIHGNQGQQSISNSSSEQKSVNLQPPLPSSSQPSSCDLHPLPSLLWPPPPPPLPISSQQSLMYCQPPLPISSQQSLMYWQPPLPSSMPPPLQSSIRSRSCTVSPVSQSCETLSQTPLQTDFEATTITRPKRWARAGRKGTAARIRAQSMYQRGGRGGRGGSKKTLIQYINLEI
ncbi:hypothetical protein PV327_011202 [Microctonus hyperodae]|uniref:Uncharacterized protein n=1 Tax=Microctonus hyperodae TaxID=165561 RepID=A0AA39FL83_MICHY|nr:hypothetical protein PV327_011202 [Microctonus hyperodae]